MDDLKKQYQKALNIAFDAHKTQVDKGGMPYILHPLRVMDTFKPEALTLRIVALLHDVLEDSIYTAESLQAQGFGEDIVQALLALTKTPDEPYAEFVKRVAQNTLARQVKIADIEDNMDMKRLPTLTKKDHERMAKYHESLRYLKSCC